MINKVLLYAYLAIETKLGISVQLPYGYRDRTTDEFSNCEFINKCFAILIQIYIQIQCIETIVRVLMYKM